MIYYNGVQTNNVYYNGVLTASDSYNGVRVRTSEESIIPTWELTGSGWVTTTWGSWSVGRNEGDLLLGIAETTIQTGGHSKLRFTPTGEGWKTGRANGAIRILINGTQKFSLGAEATRTEAVEIDLTGYSGSIAVRVELQADWGYTSMNNATALTLHD